MVRATRPMRITQRSAAFKLSAVKLSRPPGVQVEHVVQALDIHPFTLSRWRRDYREGRLRAKTQKIVLRLRLQAELGRFAELQRRYACRCRPENEAVRRHGVDICHLP